MQDEDLKTTGLPELPDEHLFDSTLALLNDPYRFISNRCKSQKGSKIITTPSSSRAS